MDWKCKIVELHLKVLWKYVSFSFLYQVPRNPCSIWLQDRNFLVLSLFCQLIRGVHPSLRVFHSTMQIRPACPSRWCRQFHRICPVNTGRLDNIHPILVTIHWLLQIVTVVVAFRKWECSKLLSTRTFISMHWTEANNWWLLCIFRTWRDEAGLLVWWWSWSKLVLVYIIYNIGRAFKLLWKSNIMNYALNFCLLYLSSETWIPKNCNFLILQLGI